MNHQLTAAKDSIARKAIGIEPGFPLVKIVHCEGSTHIVCNTCKCPILQLTASSEFIPGDVFGLGVCTGSVGPLGAGMAAFERGVVVAP
jgi:hypothetical protein